MRVYFHHVGKAMAERDFPKTVFSEVTFDRVKNSIPSSRRYREALLSQLEEAFPEGRFNVWGVPAGARSVLKEMAPGDYFLLVGLAGLHGWLPAMGRIEVYVPEDDFLDLSLELWGEDRFPLVFFFRTERIEYSWWDFTDDLDYKGHWRPAGMVYRIKPDRMASFGGPQGYINHVRNRYLMPVV